MTPTLEREVVFNPAFDKRNSDPRKNYGIHGVDMRMYVKGPRGAVQFVLYTGWMLPHVRSETGNSEPLPADLGYHSPIPLYEDQFGQESCSALGGARCYYDGSSLNADRIFDVLLNEGSDGVWRELEAYYDEVLPSLAAIEAAK